MTTTAPRRAARSPRSAPAATSTSRNATGELELYDLALDPYELQNQILNPAYDAAEASLAARLASLRACAGESCRSKPDLKLKLPHSQRRHGRSCRRPGAFLARVRGSASPRLVRASFAVGLEAAGHDSAAPFRKTLRPRLLRRKPRPEVRAVAELVDGRELSVQKRVRICR